jgi:hypothetical protein
LRELRKQVTFAVFSEEEDLEKVAVTVEGCLICWRRRFGNEGGWEEKLLRDAATTICGGHSGGELGQDVPATLVWSGREEFKSRVLE